MKVIIDVLFYPYSHPHSQSLIRRMVLIYLNKLNDITHIYFKKIQTTLQTNILCQTGLVHRHVASVYKKGGGGKLIQKKIGPKKKGILKIMMKNLARVGGTHSKNLYKQTSLFPPNIIVYHDNRKTQVRSL